MPPAATPTPRRAAAIRARPKSTRTSAAATRNGSVPVGRAAERAVARYLEARGFHIIATNLRLQYLELDVVARRDDLVVVVEVRSRSGSSWTTGFGSLDGRKRYRVRLAGMRLWQRRYRHDKSVRHMRFDAASVTFGPNGVQIEYAEAAF